MSYFMVVHVLHKCLTLQTFNRANNDIGEMQLLNADFGMQLVSSIYISAVIAKFNICRTRTVKIWALLIIFNDNYLS